MTDPPKNKREREAGGRSRSRRRPLLAVDCQAIPIVYPEGLPIVDRRDEIVEAIRNHRVLVIAGETGSGKTTQLPKMCLEAGRGTRGRIGCTQPRRIAAISVAERVAEELGEHGNLVGYKIRFRDQTSRATRVKFMTDGILLAEAQHDRDLAAYDTIIIDEAHERSLNIDFLLGLLRQLLERRPELSVIITSATIDTEKFSRHFDKAPVIEVSGRAHPVEVRYQALDPEQEEEGEQSYVDQAVAAVMALRAETRGDVLVFMPTERDILETVDGLAAALGKGDRHGPAPLLLPLFGRLSASDQKKIFLPAKTQKIVVATNVAETSITVPGIRCVVDTGLARIASYNPRARTSKLPVSPISRASCNQRLGRCGRVGPGICVRLFAEEDYANRPEYTPPEIQRANLAEVILRMVSLRLGEPATFPFVDPPSGRAIRDGYALLAELGALDEKRHLTQRGRLMARLPLDPRIARMIIEARDQNALREVVVIASALSIQDPRLRPPGKEAEADAAHARFSGAASDFLFFLALWDAYHAVLDNLGSLARMRKYCKAHYLSFPRMREWRDIHEQICLILAEEPGFAINTQPAPPVAVHRAILSGNLRNLGLKREKNLYLGAGGRELAVFPGSCQYGRSGQWIMAAELVETTRLFARTVATIEPEWIEPLARGITRSTYADPHWEKGRGQVVACERVTLFGLTIVSGRKVNYGPIKPEEARAIFIQAALVGGELRGDYDFLRQNQELLAKLEELEDRLRQRTFMVDDQTLIRFYEERLDGEVRDQQSLNRWLKQPGHRERLLMTEADLAVGAPDGEALEKFPKTLTVGEFELSLSYRFAPGEEDDGVTARVPASLFPHLRPEPFEWLVPGLLLEKVTFLLKGLPKATRRLLVPVPQTAAELVRDLIPYRGSLCQALAQAINDSHRVRVAVREWPLADLPIHLCFRFSLVDGEGRELAAGRDLAALAGATGTGSGLDRQRLGEVARRFERKAIRPEELRGAPTAIPVSDAAGGLVGYAYPGLALAGQQGVEQRIFPSAEEAAASTRLALLHLYCAEFPKQIRTLKKDLAIASPQWALAEGLGSMEELNGRIWEVVLGSVFSLAYGGIPDAARFAAVVEAVRGQGLGLAARKGFEAILQVLRERRATLDALAGLPAGLAELRQQVSLIVPPTFPLGMSQSRFPSLCRYLKALRIRAERARVAPGKDAAKAAQVAAHEERFALAAASPRPSAELTEKLHEYREMIEEFKVSLFAQELGTAFPVSAKRLEEKWREVELLR
ncbi:MAG: ATP-dependent RNA helicase HrpA [Thermodesulfobacteriota bacterium]